MSSTTDGLSEVDKLNRRIELLSGSATAEHIESLKQQRAELTGEADPEAPEPTDTDVDVVEALSSVDEAALSAPDRIDEAIEQREAKLETLGVVLPDERVAAVHDEIEALQAAREVTSPYRTNTPEALAERIEVAR